MKKTTPFLWILIVLLTAGCTNAEPAEEIGAEPFDPYYTYEEVWEYFEADPGAKLDGFVNTEVSPVFSAEEAVKLAKQECDISYDQVHYAYYEADGIWLVIFSTKGVAGGSQEIYLDNDGITRLIVYGE